MDGIIDRLPPAEAECDDEAPLDMQAVLEQFLLEDVLIEQISIDGMCGVY